MNGSDRFSSCLNQVWMWNCWPSDFQAHKSIGNNTGVGIPTIFQLWVPQVQVQCWNSKSVTESWPIMVVSQVFVVLGTWSCSCNCYLKFTYLNATICVLCVYAIQQITGLNQQGAFSWIFSVTCVTALWLEAVRQQVQTTLSAHTYIPALLVNTTTNMHVHDATVEQLLCKRTQNHMLAMGKWFVYVIYPFC